MTPLVPGLLALALLVVPTARGATARLRLLAGRGERRRVGWLSAGLVVPAGLGISVGALVGSTEGWVAAVVACLMSGGGARWLLRRRARPEAAAEQLGMAATWDLLVACLRAGLPMAQAVRAVAADLAGPAGQALRSTSDLIALGSGATEAWAPALACPQTEGLARGASRSARSGTALAVVAAELAASARDRAGDVAEARAQRAAVLIAGPLGLCFLPAFICLGIVPVVLGLVTRLPLPGQ